ncbi:MAG: hypothetical protein A3J35_00910 [Gammaproteobacteria bacterium RIFCSPLOWO2_02_FULL_52_10]|nr:MAG: hypothetical protein A3J35_00910 [Gammaproteobacteria bacterium RIFCSPLOWO2_02_FULL_52_10]OGT82462.1 MAG: hypothetical protein A3G96_06370 [Gammaproteobacteria bacterium RIFCSPLOWO2_12_FULL_52_10]
MNKPEKPDQIQVLSPWSEIDPIPLKTPALRLNGLSGKKIGLFANHKRAARPMLEVVEKWMQEKFPDITLEMYIGTETNVPEMWTRGREKFEKWIDDVDGVVLAVGD